MTQAAPVPRLIAENRKAFHDYFIEERFEAGIALEGWEVNDILREETGNDYLKMKEYDPEESSPGEKMTIAPGLGPSTEVPTPVPPASPTPTPDRSARWRR